MVMVTIIIIMIIQRCVPHWGSAPKRGVQIIMIIPPANALITPLKSTICLNIEHFRFDLDFFLFPSCCVHPYHIYVPVSIEVLIPLVRRLGLYSFIA